MALLAVGLAGVAAGPAAQTSGDHPPLELFVETTVRDDDAARTALDRLAEVWRPGYTSILWDMVRFMVPPQPPPPRTPLGRTPDGDRGLPRLEPEHPTTRVWRRLMAFLEDRTGLRLRRGYEDLARLQHWMWERPYEPHPDYAAFKGAWYASIDPAFRDFFPPGAPSTIRLDEVDWGGVPVNGIPPLEYPEAVPAGHEDARYLDDDHVVFGVAVNGATRAYPKRILAWHEMAIDRLGDAELTIVYCTLCGTVIPYESVVDGRHIRFGTSGLLYRSNKLMFDHETRSLWNTFEGRPVVGPLVGSGLQVRHRAVVTTTWAEWRRRHPDTTVLTLDTGHERDYREGAAYREYFATDDLMFQVPRLDDRLDTKDEVVVLRLEDGQGDPQPLAIAVGFLEDHPVYHTTHAGRRLVVLTSSEGANRVYETEGEQFERLLDEGRVSTDDGRIWRIEEDALVLETDPTRRVPRLAAQRAFWFGWYAQYPDTALVH